MLTIEQQANRWVVRQAEHGLDQAEQTALDAWCAADNRHRGAFGRALALHHAVVRAAAQPEPALEQSQPPVLAPVAQHAANDVQTRRRLFGLAALAAGLAAAFVAVPRFSQPSSVSIATAIGEFRRVPLADQSIANINSGSEIEVVLTDRLRQVELKQGEAWFEVAKDKSRPFVVSAGDARVRAVGTSFSVHRHALGAEVLVTEGVVEVWRKGSDGAGGKRVLTAGERAIVPERGNAIAISRDPDDIARSLAWREGKLIFTNQPLELAVADFNRYTRKQIVIADPKLAPRILIGQYRIDDPEQFARSVGVLLGAPVAITHERIIVGDVRLLDTGAKLH